MSHISDPSLLDESVQIFQNEKMFKVDNKISSFDDVFMARVFKTMTGFKIQLTSQNNITFFYQAHLDPNTINKIANDNNLYLQFDTIPQWLKHIFSQQFVYQFILKSKNQGDLKILKQEKFKNYQIVVLPFEQAPQDLIQMSLTYRYQRMKLRKQILYEQYEKMSSVIKTKNPSLFLALEKKKQKKVFK